MSHDNMWAYLSIRHVELDEVTFGVRGVDMNY